MMDLGAGICAPRKANCDLCPWAEWCVGRAQGMADSLPRKAAKKRKPTRHGICFWITRGDGAVLMRRRPERGLLGGMMEFPSGTWSEDKSAGHAIDPPLPAKWRHHERRVLHTFTHFHLELEIRIAESEHVHKTPIGADYRVSLHQKNPPQ